MNKKFRILSLLIPKTDWCFGLMIKSKNHRSGLYKLKLTSWCLGMIIKSNIYIYIYIWVKTLLKVTPGIILSNVTPPNYLFRIHILIISPLNYMFYMFLIFNPIWVRFKYTWCNSKQFIPLVRTYVVYMLRIYVNFLL